MKYLRYLSIIAILFCVSIGSQEKDIIQEIKESDEEDLVTKIKSLPKNKDAVKKFEKYLEKEYTPKVAIAYAYLLKTVEEKYFEAWKKLLAVLKGVTAKDNPDTKLVKAGAEIAMEISDVMLAEDEESAVKEKLTELFDKVSEPFGLIYLARAYQNMFIGEIRGINEIKKVLTESPNEEAQFWAAIHLVELDIIDEPMISRVLQQVANNTKHPLEKRKLAESYLNIIRLKKKLEDSGSVIPTPTTPTSKGNGKFRKIEKLMDIIMKHYAYKNELKEGEKTLIEACAKGIGDSLDLYSGYMDLSQVRRLTESVRMVYGGIGAVVSMRDGWLTIEQPVYNGPAYKAGLRTRDRIIKVGNEYTRGKTLEELVSKLKGPPGTSVTITVMRAGWEKEKEFTITREIINMGTVKYDLISQKIGYFKIVSFSDSTPVEFLRGLKELKKQAKDNLEIVIFDVRNNSGGYLDSVLKLLNYFIPANKIILTAKGDKKIAEIQEEDANFFEIKTSFEEGVFVKNIYANDRVEKVAFKHIYVLVDDGSKDNTWQALQNFKNK
ncbi:MAG: S41 family peptidase [Planctomycetota bacterium]